MCHDLVCELEKASVLVGTIVELSPPGRVSVSPQPAVQTIFETIEQGECDDDESDAPTNPPEVALTTQNGGGVFDVHPEVGGEE